MLFDEQGQIILVNMAVFIIIVFPDKAALFPVLCNGLLSQDLLVLVLCIQVKDK